MHTTSKKPGDIKSTTLNPNLNPAQMQAAAELASQFLKALSNADRLLILCQLTQGELCVGDIEQSSGVAQPTLSQQLTVLRKAQLVNTRREGKQIYYSIGNPYALTIIETLYTQFCK